MAHTSGPWHVNAIKAGRIVGDETASQFEKIMIANANATVATAYRPNDARLIAAAPELLAALQEVFTYINGMGLDGKAQQRARTAIAKATGK